MRGGIAGKLWAATIGVFTLVLLTAGSAQADWTAPEMIPGTGPEITKLDTMPIPGNGVFAYWVRKSGGDETVQATRIDSTGTPGPILSLSQSGSAIKEPLGVVAPDGDLTIGWIRSNGTNDVVQTVGVSAQGAVGTVATRSAAGNALQNAEQLSMTVTADGAVGLAWRRFNGPLWVAQAMVIPVSGAAGAVHDISTIPTSTPPPLPPPAPAKAPATFPPLENADALTPGIAALPNGTFRMAWIRDDGPRSNVITANLAADGSVTPGAGGSPGTGTLTIPEQWVEDPVTKALSVEGATGAPAGLKSIANSDGVNYIAWDRLFVARDLASGGVIGIQRGIETTVFSSAGVPSTPALASTPWVTARNVAMEVFPGLGQAMTWDSELLGGGSRASDYRRMSQTGPYGGILELPGPAPLGGFTHPSGTLGPGGWGTIGWYEDDGLGVKRAFISRLRANAVRWSTTDLSGDTFKSTEQPQVTTDGAGVPTVVFYGVDLGDSGGLWIRRYFDKQISVSPDRVNFGGSNLKVRTAPTSIFIRSSGSTENRVTGIGLDGPDAADFRVENASECLRLARAESNCEIKVSFTPSRVGASQATLEVTSEGGSASTDLTGSGIDRTSTGLSVKPKRVSVRAGRRVSVKAVVTNSGGIAATGVRVCFTGSKKIFVTTRFCPKLGNLAAGGSRSIRFVSLVKAKASPRRKHLVLVKLSAQNALDHRSSVAVKIKPRAR